MWVWALGWEVPWRRKWQPTPVLLAGKSHGQRSLVGYSPWGHRGLDMTERLNDSKQKGHQIHCLPCKCASRDRWTQLGVFKHPEEHLAGSAMVLSLGCTAVSTSGLPKVYQCPGPTHGQLNPVLWRWAWPRESLMSSGLRTTDRVSFQQVITSIDYSVVTCSQP